MNKQTILEDYWNILQSDADEETEMLHHNEDESQLDDLTEKFKNLYWSRLISLQDFRVGEHERWPMVLDIKENSEAMAALENEEESYWELQFDPRAFCEKHGELKLADYQLSEDQLKEYAVKASTIRKEITNKATCLRTVEDESESFDTG